MKAPQPGDEVAIRGVVVTSHTHEKNAHYGRGFAQLRLKLEDGPGAFRYADLRLVLDSAGKWFGPAAQRAEAELNGGEPKPRKARKVAPPAKKATASKK